ncbi:MAG: processing protein [Actinomycetota bacterium]
MRDVETWHRGVPPFPSALDNDPRPPEPLYVRGDPAALEPRRVAIVGTRHCTAYGRIVARRLGAELTDAGVAVVSGLAIGIDGASHEGVLDAGGKPIGVVASGLDIVYPRRHVALWERVGRVGLLMSEAPLGTPPETWRFPARNRIIAGLSEIVIVVESAATGGSMHTVNAAIERGIDVMVVPGPIGSSASMGTNYLLSEGATPLLGTDDVLIHLGLIESRREQPRSRNPHVDLSKPARTVLAALDFVAMPTERLLREAGLSTGALTVALEELRAAGLAHGGGGWWSRLPRN